MSQCASAGLQLPWGCWPRAAAPRRPARVAQSPSLAECLRLELQRGPRCAFECAVRAIRVAAVARAAKGRSDEVGGSSLMRR